MSFRKRSTREGCRRRECGGVLLAHFPGRRSIFPDLIEANQAGDVAVQVTSEIPRVHESNAKIEGKQQWNYVAET
jgi:hypothetical protein